MIRSLDDLRKMAVKHILRKGPADSLLRHSLCKRWVQSEHLDELAWTDYKSLFFNFPKIRAQLDAWKNTDGSMLDPGDITTAFLAATCHEILHNLFLHRYRGRGKKFQEWSAACEYAINHDLTRVFGDDWIKHLDVMQPTQNMLRWLENHDLEPTTDGFYKMLCDQENGYSIPAFTCKFCERAAEKDKEDPETTPPTLLQVLLQLDEEAPERKEVMEYLTVGEAQPQKLSWEMLLMGGIEDAVNQEQSWTTPSRRNDLQPGWRREKLLSFVWVLDVSPSIDADMKRSFMATLQAGINLYQDAQHRVIFFAQGIEEDILISSGTDLSNMEVPSGSGTCLNEVWAVLERDMPEYALVLTDLELYAVPKPSYTQIIWGVVGDCRAFNPDYGTEIILK